MCVILAKSCPDVNASTAALTSYEQRDGVRLSAEFACKDGLVVGSSMLTCGKDGVWSSDVPKCSGKPMISRVTSPLNSL